MSVVPDADVQTDADAQDARGQEFDGVVRQARGNAFDNYVASQLQQQQPPADASDSVAAPAPAPVPPPPSDESPTGPAPEATPAPAPSAPSTLPDASPTQSALSAGAPPGVLAWARSHMGLQQYNQMCEQWAENAHGVTGKYPSAIAAWNAQPDKQRTDLENAPPGSTIYYAPSAANGGYGHAALASDKPGEALSYWGPHTVNGIGQQALGWIASDGSAAPPPDTGPAPGRSISGRPLPQPSGSADRASTFDNVLAGALAKTQAAGTDVSDWLQHPDLASVAPKVEESLARGANAELGGLPGMVASRLPAGALANAQAGFNQAAGDYLTDMGQRRDQNIADITGTSNVDPLHPTDAELRRGADATTNMLLGGITGPEGDIVGPAGKALTRATETGMIPLEAERALLAEDAGQPIRDAAAKAAGGGNFWTAAQGKAGGALYEVRRLLAPAANTPEDVQTGLRGFANQQLGSEVQADTLALRAQRVLGKENNTPEAAALFEKTGQFVENPTPEQAQFAADVQGFLNTTGDAGRVAGYIKGDVRNQGLNYFPHIFEDDQAAAGLGGPNLNASNFYSHARDYPTLEAAMADGLQPKNVSESLSLYAGKVLDSQAKNDLVRTLKNVPDSPAIPMEPGGPAPRGWVPGASIAPEFADVAFTKPVAEALSNILTPSKLRTGALTGGAMKAMAAAKESLFSLSGFHLATEFRQTLRANGWPLGGVQKVGQAVWHTANPRAFMDWRLANADSFSQAARAGVTGLGRGERGADVEGALSGLRGALLRSGVSGAEGAAVGAAEAQREGADSQETLRKALVFGAAGAVLGPTVSARMSKALWERAVPTMKVATFTALRQKYAPEEVATFVNQTFGGQNLKAIARNQTVQDAIRLTALSPDWWEGWARQIGSIGNLKSDVGSMSRAYWLRTAVGSGAFGLEGLNYAFNQHFTNDNEPGREFDLETTGLLDKLGIAHQGRQYLDILGPIKPILKLATSGNVGRFANTRTSLPVSFALSAHENKDFSGMPLVQPGTPGWKAVPELAGNAMERVAPIGLQTFAQMGSRSQQTNDLSQDAAPGKTAAGAAFTALSGMRTSSGPEGQSVYDQRDGLVADILPQYTEQVKASDAYQKATPDARTRMLTAAQYDVQNAVNDQLGLPLRDKDYGLPNKYYGVSDAAKTAAIDDAITALHSWQRDPKIFPKPAVDQLRLANRYDGETTPAYTKALKVQREAADRLKVQIQAEVRARVPAAP